MDKEIMNEELELSLEEFRNVIMKIEDTFDRDLDTFINDYDQDLDRVLVQYSINNK